MKRQDCSIRKDSLSHPLIEWIETTKVEIMCEFCKGECKACEKEYQVDVHNPTAIFLRQLYLLGQEGFCVSDVIRVLCIGSAKFLSKHLKSEQDFEKFIKNLREEYYNNFLMNKS